MTSTEAGRRRPRTALRARCRRSGCRTRLGTRRSPLSSSATTHAPAKERWVTSCDRVQRLTAWRVDRTHPRTVAAERSAVGNDAPEIDGCKGPSGRIGALRLPDRGARRRRQIAGGAAQLTAKVVVVAPPDGTVTVCGFAPPTVQFAATPESATVCWVGSSAVNATLPLVATAWPAPPSTVTV